MNHACWQAANSTNSAGWASKQITEDLLKCVKTVSSLTWHLPKQDAFLLVLASVSLLIKDKVHCLRISYDTFRFEGLQRFHSSNAGLIDDWQLHHPTNNTMRDRRLKFGLLITSDNNICYFILLFLFFGMLPSKLLIVQLFAQERSRRSKWLIAHTGPSL